MLHGEHAEFCNAGLMQNSILPPVWQQRFKVSPLYPGMSSFLPECFERLGGCGGFGLVQGRFQFDSTNTVHDTGTPRNQEAASRPPHAEAPDEPRSKGRGASNRDCGHVSATERMSWPMTLG